MKKTILFYKKGHLIESVGGVEFVIANLSNAFVQKGARVFIATRDTKEGNLAFPLNKKVKIEKLKIPFSKGRRTIGKILSKIHLLKFLPFFNRELVFSKAIDTLCEKIRPDIIITTNMTDFSDFADFLYPCPVIVMTHSIPSLAWPKKREKRNTQIAPKIDAIQVLFSSFQAEVASHYKGKIYVIGNGIIPPPPSKNKSKNQTQLFILPELKNKNSSIY